MKPLDQYPTPRTDATHTPVELLKLAERLEQENAAMLEALEQISKFGYVKEKERIAKEVLALVKEQK